jgi:hypothetical protein
MSALSCAGSTSGTPAQTLTATVSNLTQCAASISRACAGAPTINNASVTICKAAIDNLTASVTNCSNLNGTAACTCWKDPMLANLSATVASCDLSAINRNMTTFKSTCQGSYTACQRVANNAPTLVSACNSKASDVLAKLSSATSNANALGSLQNVTNKLLGVKAVGKRQAVSCSAFSGLVQSVGQMALQAPGSASVAAQANDATGKAPSACAGAELAALQAASNLLSQAVAIVQALVTSLQTSLLSELPQLVYILSLSLSLPPPSLPGLGTVHTTQSRPLEIYSIFSYMSLEYYV